MKVDTLLFVIEGDKMEYSVNDILTQISEQRENFYKKFEYYPKYINIPFDVLLFLERNIDSVIHVFVNEIDKIYGMEVKTRKEETINVFSDNESICIKENKKCLY